MEREPRKDLMDHALAGLEGCRDALELEAETIVMKGKTGI
jgi:hypothetical protein